MAIKSAIERIKEIEAEKNAEIAKLTAEALAELNDKRKEALAVLQGIEDEIAQLSGKPSKARRGGSSSKGLPDVPSASALKSLLSKAGGKKLNRKGINAGGYNLKSALKFAKADSKIFGHEQNKAQGSVWLK